MVSDTAAVVSSATVRDLSLLFVSVIMATARAIVTAMSTMAIYFQTIDVVVSRSKINPPDKSLNQNS